MLFPKIYAECVSAKRAKTPHGAWIDATQSVESMQRDINDMLADSPVENSQEFEITDTADIGPIHRNECLEEIANMAELVAEYGAIAIYASEISLDANSAKIAIEEDYAGAYATLGDYAKHLTNETAKIPEDVQEFIDWGAMAQSWLVDRSFHDLEHDGKHYIFRIR